MVDVQLILNGCLILWITQCNWIFFLWFPLKNFIASFQLFLFWPPFSNHFLKEKIYSVFLKKALWILFQHLMCSTCNRPLVKKKKKSKATICDVLSMLTRQKKCPYKWHLAWCSCPTGNKNGIGEVRRKKKSLVKLPIF